MTYGTPARHPLIVDHGFAQLKASVIARTGLAYYAEKDAEFAAHVAQRMEALGIDTCEEYLGRVDHPETDPVELDALVERLTIGESFFFRHRELFDALRDHVFPELIRRNQPTRRLRIWSAGCSTGAEPYSLAILLKRDLRTLVEGWEISILGTDINRQFLSRAHDAVFEEWALRSVPEAVRSDCFRRAGRSWALESEYRTCVTFQSHNLIAHPFPSLLQNLVAFDLILCRNVMIYFDRAVLQRLVDQFHETLADGGWLLVGHAEPNVELFQRFRTINAAGAVLYQKCGEMGLAPPPWSISTTEPLTSISSADDDSVPVRETEFPISDLPAFPTLEPAKCASVEEELTAIRRQADRGQLEAALRHCELLARTSYREPAVHFHHALLLHQLGRHSHAERALRRTLYMDREYVLAHYFLALLQQKRAQHRSAARSLRNVLTLLAAWDDHTIIPETDGMSAGALRELARLQLQAQHSETSAVEGDERLK